MSEQITVQVIGTPVACSAGTRDAWRETTVLVAGQLASRFGKRVRLEYYDLFDPACPPLPREAQLPLVLVNGEVLSSGTKLSVPAIAKRLESLGLQPITH